MGEPATHAEAASPPESYAELEAHRAPRASLRANFGWTLGGNLVYAACQWLILVVLAKLGTREMVGQLAYALAVTAPITLLTNLQLRAVQATDASERFSFRTYFSLRVVGVAVAMVIVAVIAWWSPIQGLGAALVAMGAAKAVEALSDVCYGLMQRCERMELIARSMIARGLGSAAAFALGVRWIGTVAGGAWAMALAWALVLAAYDVPRAVKLLRASPPRRPPPGAPHAATIAQLARLAAPLGFVIFLVNLNGNVPRYFVEHALGLGDLGVFSAVTYLVVAGTTIVGALGQAATPRLANHHARGEDAEFLRLTRVLAGFAVATGLASAAVAAVAGRPLLAAMYRPEYAAAHEIFLWTALASSIGFAASALGYSLTAMRSFAAQAPLGIVVTAATTIGCWVLVPRFGLGGAVAATALASAVQLAGYAFLIHVERRRRRAAVTG
jgi:O-antigen/teichoic acid export membrane protein